MDVSIWTLTLEESLSESLDMLITFVPKIIAAIFLIVIGMIAGRLIAAGLRHVLALVGTDRLSAGVGLSGLLHRAGVTREVSSLAGALAYWVVWLLFAMAAVQTLGLATLSQALAAIVAYLPSLALAAVIVVLGLALANVVRDFAAEGCRTMELAHGPIVGQAGYVVVVVLSVLMAVAELGVDTMLPNTVIVLVVAGAMAAVALSIGFGARTMIANMLAAYSVRNVLTVGQDLQVGDTRGRIAALTSSAVILEREGRRVIVPASCLQEAASELRRAE